VSSDQTDAALTAVDSLIQTAGIGKIASVSGASYALDHHRLWDRIKLAYEAIANGSPVELAGEGNREGTMSRGHEGAEIHGEPPLPLPFSIEGERVRSGDACIFFDRRAGIIRELVTAFALPTFSGFPRAYIPNLRIITLIDTDPDLPVEVAFSSALVDGTLGAALSEAGLRQLRIAETEGFVSVTAGLNGSVSASPGEDRMIIPSSTVSHFEHVPEMSSGAVADRVVKEIAHGRYDVVMVNFPAPDRVAQTGDEAATVKACEAVDRAIGRIVEATLALDGVFFLASDHGHAEAIHDLTANEADGGGTCNPVPFVIVGRAHEGLKARFGDLIGGDLTLSAPSGTLADIAPTMLEILQVPVPKEMTGKSLV
jgi:2,3-bisphosphoglycerate-independent phosphoglycerate mutase